MTATLELTREGFGIELRRGAFQVLLDGTDIASIERHGTVEEPVEPGHHTLQVAAGRYTSGTLSFDAADGEVVSFRCHGAMVWPRYVVSFLKPDLAISLKRK